PIPTHGPKKLIDVAEADALWDATMSPPGAANARAASSSKRTEDPPAAVTGSQLAQARAAALVVDVQTKRLVLEQRRGALISRDVATPKAFAFARLLRDAWQAWPARVGPPPRLPGAAARAAPTAGARGPALRGHAGRPGARAVDRWPALDAYRRPADRARARPLGAARHASAAGCDAAVAALGLLVPPRRVPRSARTTPTALVGDTLVRPAQWATPRAAWLAWPAPIGP